MCGEYQETEAGKTLPPLKPDGHLKKLREKQPIERDEWLYVHTHSAERAREFFGVPVETEVKIVGPSGRHPGYQEYAVRAPKAN